MSQISQCSFVISRKLFPVPYFAFPLLNVAQRWNILWCSSSPQAQRCVTELKSQVNRLEAEVDEQRTHKQIAMVENEHLRMEVEALRCANVAGVGAQIGFKEADSESTDSCPVETAT